MHERCCTRRDRSRPFGRWRSAGLAAATAGLVALFACTERNQSYDPSKYCETGDRMCHDQDTILICDSENGWPDASVAGQWVIDCWPDTECVEGLCLPDEQASQRPCERAGECDSALVCSALPSPAKPSELEGFCVAPPYPSGRNGGEACNISSQCKSGRCTRNVCFQICQDGGDCPNSEHVCESLDLTVDGVRYLGKVKGCVPPS